MPTGEQRIFYTMHVGFFLILTASASRMVSRHGFGPGTWPELALCIGLAVIYAAGVALWDSLGRQARAAWLSVVLVGWILLVFQAPSFTWCAIPIFFLSLRLLPRRVTLVLVVVLTAVVIVAQRRLSGSWDLTLTVALVAVAMMLSAIFMELQRLIDDLIRTRGELASAQHAAGALTERGRLAREIHDTLAQGLTSMGMLLQAADRSWDTDPRAARRYVRQAEEAATGNLAEARRFVRALTPPDLLDGSLPEALRRLGERTSDHDGLDVRVQVEGIEQPLDTEVQITLLRVAQGALANVLEHADAQKAVVTLSYLDHEVTLDVFDDGAGWDGSAPPEGRGYGLRAMRERLAALGGRLVIESAPGEGTALAATIPLEGA